MVSLWPWKGEDKSPAFFEKTLSTLSTKIAQSTARLDGLRQRSRRFKALWTLYTSFAYLLYSMILALVLGWQNWGVVEYGAVAGGPVGIYVVRALVGKFFDYRISTNAQHVEDLEKQREETIDKLKAATKYNSTQQLLEKYGGESPKPSPRSNENPRKSDVKSNPSTPQQQQPVPRTGLMPPPTANINRGLSPASPGAATPPASSSSPQNLPPPPYGTPRTPFPPSHPQPQPQPQPNDEPGFAPNAFPSSQYIEQPHWYDRLLDVLLGDDETQPKNRIALLCTTCRLVNGQAAPGIKTPEELGRWRCASCGAWNGHESEASQVLANIRGQSPSPSPSQSQSQQQSASADETWDPVSRADVDTPSSGNPKDEAVFVAASEDASVGPGSPEEEEDQPSRKKDSRPAKGGKAGKRRG